MKPTDTLKHEHQIVLLVLDAMDKETSGITETGKVNINKIEKFVDFTKNFTDGCHHAKEEKHFFVKMKERGMSFDSGPIAVMLHEHEMARTFIKEIVDNLQKAGQGDAESVNAVCRNIKNYSNLLKAHINKENNILFNMADNMFTNEDQRELEAKFEKVEKEEIGEAVHEHYHQLAHEISEL
jgi:hemerythrin-like domain-containing protein